MSDLQAAGPKLHAQLSGYLEVFESEYELEFDEPAEVTLDAGIGGFEFLTKMGTRLLEESRSDSATLQEISRAESFTEMSSSSRALLESAFTHDREQFAIAREMAGRLTEIPARVRVAFLAIFRLSQRATSRSALSLLKYPVDLYLAGFDSGAIVMCDESLKAARDLCAPRQEVNGSDRQALSLKSEISPDHAQLENADSSTTERMQRLWDLFRTERGKINLALDDGASRADSALLVCAEILAEMFGDELAETIAEDEPLGYEPDLSRADDVEPHEVRDIEGVDRNELICLVRQIFADGDERERVDAISELARALGYQRTSARISDALDKSLRTAVRRGILDNSSATLRIGARSIEDYERSVVKEQFLAALGGRHWVEREDAIRGFARWLGFKRTGVAIEDNARSAINGLIREGKLESDGRMIRRTL